MARPGREPSRPADVPSLQVNLMYPPMHPTIRHPHLEGSLNPGPPLPVIAGKTISTRADLCTGPGHYLTRANSNFRMALWRLKPSNWSSHSLIIGLLLTIFLRRVILEWQSRPVNMWMSSVAPTLPSSMDHPQVHLRPTLILEPLVLLTSRFHRLTLEW